MSNIENIDNEDLEQMAELIADIIAEREKRGISQSALAGMSGVKQSAISRMESLKSLPQLDTLIKIIRPLGLRLIIVDENNLKEYMKNMNYTATGIRSFKIDVISAKVSVEAYDGDDFIVETEKEKEFMFTEKNGELVFAQKKRNIFKRMFQFKTIPVRMFVPAAFHGPVTCNADNGRVTATGLDVESLSLFADNGAALADNIRAGELSAKSFNGRVVVTNSVLSSIEASSSNGRVIITDTTVAGSIEATSSNGKVIASGCKAGSFMLRTSNGSVIASECLSDKYNLTSSNGKIVVVAEGIAGEYGYELKTANGAIHINNEKFRGNYIEKGKPKSIKATTSNGSINIAFTGFISDDIKSEIESEKKYAANADNDLDNNM